MRFDLLYRVSGLGLIRGLPKLSIEKDLSCLIVQVACACLDVCLSSIDKILSSLLQGELASFIDFGTWFDLSCFEGGVCSFAIEKPCVLIATLLSFKLGVCHPYGFV
jgi:uncharacterized membrane protein YhdT